MRREKGFTLIEILVVVAIIAILASIVVVGLSGFRSRGRDARRVSDLHTVQTVLELYYAQNRAYPATTPWANLVNELESAGLGITTVPGDPLPGQAYGYCAYKGGTADNQHYVLEANLEAPDAQVTQDSYAGSDCQPGGANCSSGGTIYCVQF